MLHSVVHVHITDLTLLNAIIGAVNLGYKFGTIRCHFSLGFTRDSDFCLSLFSDHALPLLHNFAIMIDWYSL